MPHQKGTSELYLWTKIFFGRKASSPHGNRFIIEGTAYRELVQLIKDRCDFDLNGDLEGKKLGPLVESLNTNLKDGGVDAWLASHNGILQRRDVLMFYFFLKTCGGAVKYVLEQHFGSD